MKTDPKVRKDGMCAQCRKPRTPKKGLSGQSGSFAKLFAVEVERDPFCSAVCAKTWHGVSLAISPGSSRIPPERIAKWEGAEESRKRRERIREKGLPADHTKSAANYRNGCRCEGCREAQLERQRQIRKDSMEPCSHGCGRMVHTRGRKNNRKPLECRSCAATRINAERHAA